MITCCLNCTSRHHACHDTCEKYKTEKKDFEERKAFVYELNHSQSVYHRDYEDKHKGVAFDCAADLVLALAEQLENAPSTAWTSVKDKQPEEDGIYLVVYDFWNWENLIATREFVNGKWVDNKNPVKFWMLVPKIPGDNE